MKRENNSDPLPYTQVDRAVKPKAALLAGAIGVTTQHALGALVEFWEMNGEPRELERLVTEGKREIVLNGDELTGRFFIASGGKEVTPSLLVRLGLAEEVAQDSFRVRGMSRYFKPIEARLQARQAGSVGGKASVAARKAANGTAQPRSGTASNTAQADSEALPKRPRSAPEADSEALPKRSRSGAEPTDSGQRSPPSKSSSSAADLFALVEQTQDAPAEMLEVWNKHASGRIPKARLTPERAGRLRDWVCAHGLSQWEPLVRRVNAAPLLRGERGNWKASLDWVLKPANLAKVLDGNYDDRDVRPAPQAGPPCAVPGCKDPGGRGPDDAHPLCLAHDANLAGWWHRQRFPDDRFWQAPDWDAFVADIETRRAS